MRTVALFGMPLKRQHSAVMHNAAFAAAGLDVRYELREVSAGELPAQVETARRENWLGFQITAPHKQAVMPLLDEIEDAAASIGAVNSVIRDGERLVGFNTDVTGFLAGLSTITDGLAGRNVVLAGSGGVGHAAAYGLASSAPARLSVLDLEIEMPKRLADRFADIADIEALAFDSPQTSARLAEADLFVNATSVGMLTPGPVVDPALLPGGAAVFDVVYIPPETELVRQARARGLPAANGDRMLVAQAASAWMRWTGLPDPTLVMSEAVAPLLARPDLEP